MNNIHEIAREWAQNILPDPSTVDPRRDPYDAAHAIEDAARKDASKRGAPTEPDGWYRDVGAWRTQLRIAIMKRIESSRVRRAHLVIGTGKAGAWSKGAVAVEPTDKGLLALARERGLYADAQKRGVASLDGNMLGDGWLLVVGVHVQQSDLDADPSVIAYCDAE